MSRFFLIFPGLSKVPIRPYPGGRNGGTINLWRLRSRHGVREKPKKYSDLRMPRSKIDSGSALENKTGHASTEYRVPRDL